MPYKTVTKEDVLEDLRECHRRNGKVNGRILNEEDDLVCRKTVYNKFGSVNDAIEEAGLDYYHPQTKEMIEVDCEWCGEPKEIYPYREDEAEHFFCDYDCEGLWLSENVAGEDHPLYKGDGDWTKKYGPMWHKKREERLEEDGYECVICGIANEEHREKYGQGLDVHHLIPRRKFYKSEELSIDEANELENLRTVCKPHHHQVESGEIKIQ